MQAKLECQNYNFYQEISSLDKTVIDDAIRSFEKMKACGTLKADGFESDKWFMTDGVRRSVTIDFNIDEVAFSKNSRQLLDCTLRDYAYAMRVAVCCNFGYSLEKLQSQVSILRNFACGQYECCQYEDAQILLDLLLILPGYSMSRSKEIRRLESIHPDFSSKNSNQRTLANYQTYIRFDYFLNEWWNNATAEDRVRYFPVYFWWKVTVILPLRPTECAMTPRNCIRKEGNRYYLTVRRTKLKGTRQAGTYILDQDYKKMEYRITEELGMEIEQYITVTNPIYRSSIDTLFCKTSQFSLLNITQESNSYYGYPNLRQCLDHFYSDVLIGQFGLTVVEDCDLLTSPDEIEYVNLGDTRHIAMVSLMISGGSPSVCRALGDQDSIDISSNYYTNIEPFLTAVSREGYRISKRESYGGNETKKKSLTAVDRTLKIKGGYCQSKLAQKGNFCDCACAVTTEGGFGDCRVCEHFIPVGTSLAEYTASASQEMRATCVLLKQSIESIRQGNGSSDTLSEVLDRLHAQALKYCHLSALTKLIKEVEESQ